MTSKRPIRLLLVDDHSVVRMGLAALLGLDRNFTVVAEAEDGEQAFVKYQTERPDIVLMDVRMPGMGGVAAVRALRAKWPEARILMLTTSELEEDIYHAIEAGASGYILKSATREQLTQAINTLHAGESYIPSAIAERLKEHSKRKHLSQREIEVLDGMRRGLSNRDIGMALGISEHTVKAHAKAIFQKLESADRTEAVAQGFEQGLLRVNAH